METIKDMAPRLLGILIILASFSYYIFGNPMIYLNNARLKSSLQQLSPGAITLEEAAPFSWTTVYTFEPYTPMKTIRKAIGTGSPALKTSVSEGMTHVVFVKNSRIVSSVCAYPQSLGYSLDFTGGSNTTYPYQQGGYSRLDYGSETTFTVTQEDGYLALYAKITS